MLTRNVGTRYHHCHGKLSRAEVSLRLKLEEILVESKVILTSFYAMDDEEGYCMHMAYGLEVGDLGCIHAYRLALAQVGLDNSVIWGKSDFGTSSLITYLVLDHKKVQKALAQIV